MNHWSAFGKAQSGSNIILHSRRRKKVWTGRPRYKRCKNRTGVLPTERHSDPAAEEGRTSIASVDPGEAGKMVKPRQGFRPANSSSSAMTSDRMRTHLMFSSQAEHHIAKRKRPIRSKQQQSLHKKDEMVQTGISDMEPSLWSGNQRMMHFGPMASRDPFFYYYPKGWDILYPAHFGFFPYRATKFRGSSSAICIGAFGMFLLFGGALMLYLVYFDAGILWPFVSAAQSVPFPIRIAGPALFVFGICLMLTAVICSVSSLKLFAQNLDEPPRVTILTRYFKEPKALYEESPYQPLPPPAYPVLENKYAKSSMYNPQSELKLYPPVLPGCSTLSLHSQATSAFVANPYNTLRAVSINRHYTPVDGVGSSSAIKENFRSESVAATRRRSSESSHTTQRRAKSAPRLKGDRLRGA